MALYPPPSSGGSSGSTVAATAASAVDATYINVGHNSSNMNALYTVPSGKVFIGTLQAYHGIKINSTGSTNSYLPGTGNNGNGHTGKVITLPAGTVVYPGYQDSNWKYCHGVELPAPTTHANTMVFTRNGPNS
mgnify:CR=1 FL=1|tara:strand:- start:2754 stop:3152 length:399 start_codon:yes stop_codon:yes gene_type:complete